MSYKRYSKGTSTAGVIGGCLLVVAIMLGIVAISGLIFMVAWNVIAPVFGWPTLTWLQATAFAFLITLVGSAFRGVRASVSK